MDNSENSTPPRLETPPPQPPPLMSSLRPPAPRRRVGSWVVILLVCCLAAFGLVGLFAFKLNRSFSSLLKGETGSAHSGGPRLEEVTVESDETENKIVVIPVEGIIMSEALDRGFSMVEMIEEQLKRAADDDHVKAVILKVDSPGGEVLASDDINHLLADFQEQNDIPVIASMGSLAASGGYYVSAPCQWIVANKLTLTGSIGVIMSTLNYRGLMDKVGVRPEVFKSGRFKDMLRGSKSESEITQEERDMNQALINDAYGEFKNVVAEGRKKANDKNKHEDEPGQALVKNWEQYADGRVLTGREAFKIGLVDELGNFDAAVESAKRLADIEKANLVKYHEVFDLASLFRLFGKSQTPAIKVDLGLETPRVKPGRMYYLMPTFVY